MLVHFGGGIIRSLVYHWVCTYHPGWWKVRLGCKPDLGIFQQKSPRCNTPPKKNGHVSLLPEIRDHF